MPKYQTTSRLFAPVEKRIKNVYSLRKQTGTTSGELPTHSRLFDQLTNQAVHNSLVTPLFIQPFTPQFYTPNIRGLYLLHSWLYPQSTPPINKKKKEKLERNT